LNARQTTLKKTKKKNIELREVGGFRWSLNVKATGNCFGKVHIYGENDEV